MYASLIAAGVSQLYDLYKGATSGSTATDTSFKPSTPDDSSSTVSSTSSATATGAVNSTSTSGGGLSDALHKLFTDLQSSSSSGTDSTSATDTVAGDLQSVFKQVKAGGAHGHHPGGPPPGPPSGSDDTASTDGSTSSTSASNPFGSLAASLLSYTKTQGLSAASTSSTSLTA